MGILEQAGQLASPTSTMGLGLAIGQLGERGTDTLGNVIAAPKELLGATTYNKEVVRDSNSRALLWVVWEHS